MADANFDHTPGFTLAGRASSHQHNRHVGLNDAAVCIVDVNQCASLATPKAAKHSQRPHYFSAPKARITPTLNNPSQPHAQRLGPLGHSAYGRLATAQGDDMSDMLPRRCMMSAQIDKGHHAAVTVHGMHECAHSKQSWSSVANVHGEEHHHDPAEPPSTSSSHHSCCLFSATCCTATLAGIHCRAMCTLNQWAYLLSTHAMFQTQTPSSSFFNNTTWHIVDAEPQSTLCSSPQERQWMSSRDKTTLCCFPPAPSRRCC